MSKCDFWYERVTYLQLIYIVFSVNAHTISMNKKYTKSDDCTLNFIDF